MKTIVVLSEERVKKPEKTPAINMKTAYHIGLSCLFEQHYHYVVGGPARRGAVCSKF